MEMKELKSTKSKPNGSSPIRVSMRIRYRELNFSFSVAISAAIAGAIIAWLAS